jgi:recombinational DNA repair ATPase RecF
MKRTIKVKNDKLYKLLEEKNEVLAKAREVNEQNKILTEELQKYGLELNKYKEKLFPLVDQIKDEMGEDLGEFEEFETVEAIDGEIEIVIFDAIEEYKDLYRLKKYEELKKKEEEADKKSKD